MIEQGERCPRCGTYYWMWETQDPETGEFQAIHPPPYEADLWRCQGCKSYDELDAKMDAKPDYSLWGLRKRLFPTVIGDGDGAS